MEGEEQEAVEARHRAERKELQDKVMQLKNSVSKGDKKKKKEINAEITKLEGDMNERHSAELMDLMLNAISIGETEDVLEEEEEETREDNKSEPEVKELRVSKAQKRRDKKVEKAKQRVADIEAQDEANLEGARHLEQERITGLLAARGLVGREVPSDGDCMFAAVAHQLGEEGAGTTVAALRRGTAEELRRGRDAYWPFLSNPRTGEMLSDGEYSAYCTAMADTPAWGGQVELRALATLLNRPLAVIQAEGQEEVVVGEEEQGAPITLSYHRHIFGLGEHYNSVTKL